MEELTDIQLFNKIYRDYYKRLLKFAYSYLQDTQTAEDITTEAFITYWENKDTLASGSNIPAYILTVIKNKCLNYLQRRNLQGKIFDELSDNYSWKSNTHILTLQACNPEELFITDIQDIIKDTLDKLPQRTHDIFILSRFEGKSHKEIASILKITPKGVEFHIGKAIEILRINLKDYLTTLLNIFIT